MIDWARVKELQSEIGPEGFAEVLELFLDEVESVVMNLGARPDRLGEELHFLKGSAWNLGFREFGAMCQDGERKCAAGNCAAVDLRSIITCYGASKEVFMTRAEEFCRAA
ncbi:MAG: Hpt domain-containing protein [Sphingomonadales bacterium]|nr:Hpt domain-containing protein [Sphingomonadales bacterium]